MGLRVTRSTTNRNSRGSTRDRLRRKLWLLDTFGDGTSAPCAGECGTVLTLDTVTVDRWPVLGIHGGTYARGNIRPMCAPCNYSAGGRIGAQRRASASATESLPVSVRDTDALRTYNRA